MAIENKRKRVNASKRLRLQSTEPVLLWESMLTPVHFSILYFDDFPVFQKQILGVLILYIE